jgi:putative Holliday junction resolvase
MPGARAADGCILGFDFGARRIGVAVGQRTTCTASSLETIANGREPDWGALDRLVRDWKPRQLLVGLPLNAEGEETDMSRNARRFGESLRERYGLDVHYADERLSSRAAEGRFAELRAAGTLRRKHARRLDAMSAQVILESWLVSRNG